ncbi:MAG: hypothetical protein AAB910_02690 [Patescibacteria group bacterium]
MATIETCPEFDNCGFVKFLGGKQETAVSDCGKKPSACGRLNPIVPIDIGIEGVVTEDEIKIAFPVLYEDENGKPRRILKGTHR